MRYGAVAFRVLHDALLTTRLRVQAYAISRSMVRPGGPDVQHDACAGKSPFRAWDLDGRGADPEIGPNDVLIKVRKTAICGTDVHIYNWDQWALKTVPVPMVTGHEFVGTVADFGAAVTEYKVGSASRARGTSSAATAATAGGRGGASLPQHAGRRRQRPGAFGEYLAIPQHNVVPIPDDIPDEIAAIFDPLGNAVHTALSFDLVGEDVLVTGAGPIGIMARWWRSAVGARKVVITDINPVRLELARKLGVQHVVDASKERLRDVMREVGMTEGFDVGSKCRAPRPPSAT